MTNPDQVSSDPRRAQRTVEMETSGQGGLINDPSPEDCSKLVDQISRGHYVRATATHEPLPCFSNFHINGLVAVVFSNESAAASLARNGGVHEHLVTFETCREAVNRVLLGERPLLQRLTEATSGGEDR